MFASVQMYRACPEPANGSMPFFPLPPAFFTLSSASLAERQRVFDQVHGLNWLRAGGCEC